MCSYWFPTWDLKQSLRNIVLVTKICTSKLEAVATQYAVSKTIDFADH